ncbi:Stp1/IreP family PP2C-type Ser/Thr phosphatase [Streptococcus pseudopneumoniae]|uniref:Stp1/IreP family PP2C-type Ser/Thr phosphatase n=1 Tax=Streptococcus pseudopneumoniae TaxID=257758 RepID=UPI00066DC466|nr:Stp1/IreP family PP2C-type Ser/Thr phosphatase [Streptococcus pseudopneumoniae]
MEISLLTDVGQKRTNNQDYVNHYVNRVGCTMIILADGMGGHRAGNIASEMAVTDLGVAWVDTQIDTVNEVREWFANNLEIENQKINQLGQAEAYKGMGTTLEAVAIIDNQAIYAHIGDSRISLIRGEEYHQLTSDHSLVNELLKAGQLTPEEAASHPQKNIITQSIGQKDEIQPDFGIITLESGDYLLLNSDGLTNMISGSEIYDIVTSDISLEDKAATLIRFANNAGGLDNITVALIAVNEEAIE